MLTADELRASIADHESDRVELTVSTTAWGGASSRSASRAAVV